MVRIGIALVGLSACVLVGCGSGSKPVPDAPNLDVSIRANRIDLSWNSVVAGQYTLYRDADGVAGDGAFEPYQQLPSYAVNLTIPAAVHLFDWESEPEFYLEGCNLNGCAATRVYTVKEEFNRLATGYFKASNATADKPDQFGSSVAFNGTGNFMVVGAPFEDSASKGTILGDGSLAGQPIDDRSVDGYVAARESGAAYVYAINNFGQWVQLNYLKIPDISELSVEPDPEAPAVELEGDQFGYTVAISGNGLYLAVGAPKDDVGEVDCVPADDGDDCSASYVENSSVDSGAVYIYELISSQWVLRNYIKPETVIEGAAFGSSLSFNYVGNTLAIGAPNDNVGDSFAGNDGIFNDDEAPSAAGTATDSGAAYVIVRTGTDASNGATIWEKQATIKAPTVVDGEHFGMVAKISEEGNTLAISAPDADSGAFTSAGDVHVYNRESVDYIDEFGEEQSKIDWVYKIQLEPPVAESSMGFGTALDFSYFGDDLIVGAPGASGGNGAAYMYQRASEEWDTNALIFDADTLLGEGQSANSGSGDAFGSAVSMISLASVVDVDLLDDTAYIAMVAIGAPGEDGSAQGVAGDPDDNASGSGAVYLFLQDSDAVWTRTRYIKASNSAAAFAFGSGLALSQTGASLLVAAPDEPVSSGGIGPNPDGDDPTDAVYQDAPGTPGIGAVYLY